jgi:hypothetical protein
MAVVLAFIANICWLCSASDASVAQWLTAHLHFACELSLPVVLFHSDKVGVRHSANDRQFKSNHCYQYNHFSFGRRVPSKAT